jgi:hypothetical protein
MRLYKTSDYEPSEILGYPHKVGHEYPLSRSKRLSGFGFVQTYVGCQILYFLKKMFYKVE